MHYITLDVSEPVALVPGDRATFGGGTGSTRSGTTAASPSTSPTGATTATPRTSRPASTAGKTSSTRRRRRRAERALDGGEDVNANTVDVVDVYGAVPELRTELMPTAAFRLPRRLRQRAAQRPARCGRGRPRCSAAAQAQVNRAILFRRALKLTNGDNIRGHGVTGLTIVSENPVYVQGDWNANPATRLHRRARGHRPSSPTP